MIYELGSIGIKIIGFIKDYDTIFKHATEIFLNHKRFV